MLLPHRSPCDFIECCFQVLTIQFHVSILDSSITNKISGGGYRIRGSEWLGDSFAYESYRKVLPMSQEYFVTYVSVWSRVSARRGFIIYDEKQIGRADPKGRQLGR